MDGIKQRNLSAYAVPKVFRAIRESECEMLVLTPLTLFVAAAAALQNPHRRVKQRTAPADQLVKRAEPPQTEYQYLNDNTES